MGNPPIPDGPTSITASWLKQALSAGGTSDLPAIAIKEVDVEGVGSGVGLMGEVLRCRLTYKDDAPSSPDSVIVKLPSPHPKNLKMSKLLQLYRREYSFYIRLAPHVPIHVAALYYGDFEENTVQLLGLKADNSLTVCYARVSSHDQKADLDRQQALLESYCAAQGWTSVVIRDLGSGMNYRKKGLRQLLEMVLERRMRRLVLTHKDRLLRFGAELVFALCELQGIEIVIIHAGEQASFEEELAQDVVEIITVFSARLYGARSRKQEAQEAIGYADRPGD